MKKTILLSLMLALAIANANAYEALAGFDGPTWDAYTEAITEGNGSESNPYLIKTAGQLAQLASEVNNGDSKDGMFYQIAADISLNKRTEDGRVQWVPIGFDDSHTFKGTLTNAGSYVISGMMISVVSTVTIQKFGLFGRLMEGTLENIKLENGELRLKGVGSDYMAGLLCGEMIGYMRHCNSQGYIDAEGISGSPKIGGLVGVCFTSYANGYIENEMLSCIANTEIKLKGNNTTGSVMAGGVAGQCMGPMTDCHALVDLDASELAVSNTDNTPWTCLGGVVGLCRPAVPRGVINMKYCSASGKVLADKQSYTRVGGLVGSNEYPSVSSLHLSFCCTTTTVRGGRSLGGLIGCCYVYTSLEANQGTEINCCVSGAYVDARDARNAGGLIGYLVNRSSYNDVRVTDAGYSFFVGTMAKPTNSTKYGTIFGGSSGLSATSFNIGELHYYGTMCNMQTNGDGKELTRTKSMGGTMPNQDHYGCFGINWGHHDETGYATLSHPEIAARLFDHIEMCYTDNYKLCDLLFYITNDWSTLYSANDVTIDFSIDDVTNAESGARAVFTVPDNVTCVKVVDKHLYPLDPGEVVVTAKWGGLEREVHLDITYGKDWEGGSSVFFDNVYYDSQGNPSSDFANYNADGSAEKPYLIHSANQLNGVLRSNKYNQTGVHFKLANDIFFNTHLLQENGTPRSGAIAWEPFDFKGILDGNGKTIYGVYVNKNSLGDGESLGFFKNLNGTVKNLAIVDSNVSTDEVSNPNSSAGLLCGTLKEGASVSNCLFHGRVSASSYCSGIAGRVDANNTSITDCFANVHVTYPASSSNPFTASGLCYNTPAAMEYCLYTGRVENFINRYGISDGAGTTCHYDKQMMAGEDHNQTIGSTTTEILSGNLMGGSNAWQQDDERYPMLKTFADTPYGKMLAMPVLFDGTDCAGNVNYIFEFPTDDVSWRALNGQTYIDVINDCGAASIVERTDDNVEILIAQAVNVESQCTRALRTLPLNLRSGLTSFRFKDPVAQSAAFTAFNNEAPEDVLTLRELVQATKSDFDVFNREATGLQWFPEFRYFTTIEILEEGMLSGLDKLSELQLPKKLTTIDGNAFNGCSSLEEITLPQTFATLNEGGLYGSGIKNLLVNYKHPNMRSIAGALFQTDNDGKLHLVAYPPGRGEEDATISTLFHYIDDYAFYKVPNLRNIYIDNCLPEGNYVDATDNEIPIVPEEGTEILEIYVNDGSWGTVGSSYGPLLFSEYEDENSFWSYNYEDHLHIYYPLSMTSAGWATLYIGFPTRLPEGFNAYVVTVSDDDAKVAKLKNIGRVIPKTTPVVIKNTAGLDPGIYPLTRWEGAVPNVPKYDNRFVGTFIGQEGKWGLEVNQETSITGGVLTLGRNSKGVVGFYKYNGAVIPPYRAYLTTNTVIEGAKGFTFVIDDTIDETPTAIQNAPSLREEQSSVFYDMTGRALQGTPTRPGVYIRNGKRFVVK